MAVEEEPLPAHWVVLEGEEGCYFYNEETGASQWGLPAPVECPPVEAVDDEDDDMSDAEPQEECCEVEQEEDPDKLEVDEGEGDGEGEGEGEGEGDGDGQGGQGDLPLAFGPQPLLLCLEVLALPLAENPPRQRVRAVVPDNDYSDTAVAGVQALLACADGFPFRVEAVWAHGDRIKKGTVTDEEDPEGPLEGELYVDLVCLDARWDGLEGPEPKGALSLCFAAPDVEEALFSTLRSLAGEASEKAEAKEEGGQGEQAADHWSVPRNAAEVLSWARDLFPEAVGTVTEADLEPALLGSPLLELCGPAPSTSLGPEGAGGEAEEGAGAEAEAEAEVEAEPAAHLIARKVETSPLEESAVRALGWLLRRKRASEGDVLQEAWEVLADELEAILGVRGPSGRELWRRLLESSPLLQFRYTEATGHLVGLPRPEALPQWLQYLGGDASEAEQMEPDAGARRERASLSGRRGRDSEVPRRSGTREAPRLTPRSVEKDRKSRGAKRSRSKSRQQSQRGRRRREGAGRSRDLDSDRHRDRRRDDDRERESRQRRGDPHHGRDRDRHRDRDRGRRRSEGRSARGGGGGRRSSHGRSARGRRQQSSRSAQSARSRSPRAGEYRPPPEVKGSIEERLAALLSSPLLGVAGAAAAAAAAAAATAAPAPPPRRQQQQPQPPPPAAERGSRGGHHRPSERERERERERSSSRGRRRRQAEREVDVLRGGWQAGEDSGPSAPSAAPRPGTSGSRSAGPSSNGARSAPVPKPRPPNGPPPPPRPPPGPPPPPASSPPAHRRWDAVPPPKPKFDAVPPPVWDSGAEAAANGGRASYYGGYEQSGPSESDRWGRGQRY